MRRTTKLLVGWIVAALLAASSTSATDFGFHGYEIRGGGVVASDYDTGFTLGVGIDFGEIRDHVRLFGVLTYSSASETVGFSCAPLPAEACPDLELDVSAISVDVDARWMRPASEFYWGGGVSLQAIDGEVTVDFASGSSDETQLYLVGLVGYGHTGSWSIEGRYYEGSLFESFPAFERIGLYFVWRPDR